MGIDDVVAVCTENQVAAIIATNTTVDHSTVPQQLDQTGGLSGAPLEEKSTAVITAIRSKCPLPVIGCGGIVDADSALRKADAGASLVQLYTGLIYRGPGLLREIGRAFTNRDWTTEDD
jgi:dihydroorotate dehydrogenase